MAAARMAAVATTAAPAVGWRKLRAAVPIRAATMPVAGCPMRVAAAATWQAAACQKLPAVAPMQAADVLRTPAPQASAAEALSLANADSCSESATHFVAARIAMAVAQKPTGANGTTIRRAIARRALPMRVPEAEDNTILQQHVAARGLANKASTSAKSFASPSKIRASAVVNTNNKKSVPKPRGLQPLGFFYVCTMPNSSRAFAVVWAANSSSETSRTSAKHAAVCRT